MSEGVRFFQLFCLDHQKKLPISGDGKNVRDWLFVGDHCDALDIVFHQGKNGETYNIGGDNEISNMSLAYTICDMCLEKNIHKNKIEYNTRSASK